MKRILRLISLFLAIACLLTLTACKRKNKNGEETQPVDNPDFAQVDPAATVEYIVWAMAASEPTKIATHSEYVLTVDGETVQLNGDATLQIMKEGSTVSAKGTYSQEMLSDAGAEEPKTTVTGTEYSDGERYATVSDGGVTWSRYRVTDPDMGNVRLSGATVAAEGSGYKLTYTFAASQAANVLGQAIPTAVGSVTLTVTVEGGLLRSSTLSYATADGNMSVSSVYTYYAESFSKP